jgi:hypothetical protein
MGLITFLVCAPSFAQTVDPGEAAIRRGVELRRHGQDEQALEAFRKAYQTSPSPRALAQIGLAEQALGRWVDAEHDIRQALESSVDPWIGKNAVVLRGALEAIGKHIGSVQVLGEPAGAEVLIQGKDAGRLPMPSPVRVPIGDAQIEVRCPGFRGSSRVVTVVAGVLSRETIVLVRPVAAEPGSPPAMGPDLGLTRSPVAPSPSPSPSSELDVSPPRWRRPAVWVAAGLGVVGVGLGVVETLVAIQKSKDFNRLPDNCMDGGNGNILGGARCVQADHDQSVATWAAAIGFGLGGLFAMTAVVLHLNRPAAAERKAAWLTCVPSLSSAGGACVVRW